MMIYFQGVTIYFHGMKIIMYCHRKDLYPQKRPSRHDDGLLHYPIITSSYDSCTTANSIVAAFLKGKSGE